MADGRAALFASSGPLDGPLPTYYEPFESPFTNLLYPKIGTRAASTGAGPTIRSTRPAAASTR
jgi:hypothetical protein